jgi:hypothetical protein
MAIGVFYEEHLGLDLLPGIAGVVGPVVDNVILRASEIAALSSNANDGRCLQRLQRDGGRMSVTKSLLIPGWAMSGLYMKKVLQLIHSIGAIVQILRHVWQLPCLNKEVGVVDQRDGAEGASVVLGPHPTAIKHTAIQEKLIKNKLGAKGSVENERINYMRLTFGSPRTSMPLGSLSCWMWCTQLTYAFSCASGAEIPEVRIS